MWTLNGMVCVWVFFLLLRNAILYRFNRKWKRFNGKKWNDVSENWDKYGWIESSTGNVNKQMELGLLRLLKSVYVWVAFCICCQVFWSNSIKSVAKNSANRKALCFFPGVFLGTPKQIDVKCGIWSEYAIGEWGLFSILLMPVIEIERKISGQILLSC